MIDGVAGDVVSGRVWGILGQIHLEFFRSASCDPSDNGEGEHFLGSTDVTTAGTLPFATFTWTSPPSTPLQPTDIVTATATSADGTSEFSPCWPTPSIGGDTPVGTDVVTQPVDSTTGTSPVLLGFSNVTTAGTTSLATSDTGPTVPTGFTLGDPPTYFDVSTTATYSGSIDICISYADVAFIDPAALRLYHYDTGISTWVDVTSSVDTDAKLVCGTVTSLSPFALVQARPAFTSGASTTMTVGVNGSFPIATSGFKHPSLTVVGSLPSGVTLTDHGDGTAALAGTPATAAGAVYPITLRGSEAGVTVDQAFTLTIREASAFTSAAATTFTIGVPGTFTVATRGYPRPTLTKTGSLPSGLTFDVSTGVLAGTPAANTPATSTAGTYKLTLKATNGVGSVAQQVLTITIAKRASSVTATCTPDPTVPGTSITCTATIRDTGSGTASTPTGSITWSVVAGSGKFSGATCKTQAGTRVCTATYTSGLTQTSDQRLLASAPADTNHVASSGAVTSRLIVTVPDAYTTPRNVTLNVAPPGVLANDRNTTGGTVALIAGPGHGTLTLRSDGSISYVPARNFHGKDAFAYRVRVGSTWSLPTVVTITVS